MDVLEEHLFRVTLDVRVAVKQIDDEQAEHTKASFHNDALAQSDDTREELARDRRLLAALLQHPDALRALLIRHVAWTLSSPNPVDGSLEAAQGTKDSDSEMLEQLQSLLPPEDYAFLRDVAAEDILYDNTMFFQDSFSVTQHSLKIEQIAAS